MNANSICYDYSPISTLQLVVVALTKGFIRLTH